MYGPLPLPGPLQTHQLPSHLGCSYVVVAQLGWHRAQLRSLLSRYSAVFSVVVVMVVMVVIILVSPIMTETMVMRAVVTVVVIMVGAGRGDTGGDCEVDT